MESVVAVFHLIFAVVLIGLILIQDAKSGIGVMGGGGGSSSLFGATGAATAAAKATRYVAVLFAVTCVTLTMFANRKESSVIDNVITVPTSSTTAPVESSTAVPTEATGSATPGAATAPAAEAPANPSGQSNQ